MFSLPPISRSRSLTASPLLDFVSPLAVFDSDRIRQLKKLREISFSGTAETIYVKLHPEVLRSEILYFSSLQKQTEGGPV